MNSGAPVTRRDVLKAGVGLAAVSVLDGCGGGHGSQSNTVRYAVHPAFGVARVGNSASDFFYAQEVPGPLPEPIGGFRDAGGALKRQAARFRIYGYDAAGAVVREITASEEQSTIVADVVIDCSGRRAAFARRLGAERNRLDRLVACAALLTTTASDTDATTLIEAVPDGWWYTARLPDASRIVMFLTDGDLPAAHTVRALDRFRARLGATRHVAPLCTACGYEISSPLRVAAADTGRLNVVCGDGWIAAGDAAASFDPISSQGIMTAMQFGQMAAEAVLDGSRIGYAAAVDACYERYVGMRTSVYAQERRWADAPFWARRHRPQVA